MMKSAALLFPLVAVSVAHGDEWKKVTVVSPIKVNKSTEYPSARVETKIDETRSRIRDRSQFALNIGTEILKDGRLYSTDDISKLQDDEVLSLLNSDHCEIFEAFRLYQPGKTLKGKLLLHVYFPKASNLMTHFASTSEGTTNTQLLSQEYFIVNPKNRKDLLGMVLCFSHLRSNSDTEAQAKFDAYEAAGTYAPFIQQLSKK